MATGNDKSDASCRVALLIAEGEMGWCVANHLGRHFNELLVLVEQPETKVAILRRRARMLGWPTALGQAAGGIATKALTHLCRRRIAEICRDGGLDTTPWPARTVHAVASVNSDATRAVLAAFQPDVVAVYGTRIIRRETLTSVAAPFINYHAGINPKYRGQHPGYWALVNGDKERAGVTIHLVDEGVDTGDVLRQAGVEFTPHDNITTYQWRQMTVGLPLLVKSIEDGLGDCLRPYRVELPSTQHFPPTLWGYVWNGATRGVW